MNVRRSIKNKKEVNEWFVWSCSSVASSATKNSVSPAVIHDQVAQQPDKVTAPLKESSECLLTSPISASILTTHHVLRPKQRSPGQTLEVSAKVFPFLIHIDKPSCFHSLQAPSPPGPLLKKGIIGPRRKEATGPSSHLFWPKQKWVWRRCKTGESRTEQIMLKKKNISLKHNLKRK